MGENNGRLAKTEFETQAVRMFSAPSISENTLTLQLLFTSAAQNLFRKWELWNLKFSETGTSAEAKVLIWMQKNKKCNVSAGNSGCPPKKKWSFTTNTVLQKNSVHFKKLQGWGGCRLENTRTILQPSQQGNVAPHSFLQTESNFQGRSHAYEREAADITFLSELKIPKRKKLCFLLRVLYSIWLVHCYKMKSLLLKYFRR